MKMNLGPQKTEVGKFGGFSFGVKPGGTSRPGSPAASRPLAPPRRPGGAKPAAGSAVSALFAESVDHDERSGRSAGLPTWNKITPEAVAAQRIAESLQAADPSVFQYDEVIDSLREEAGYETGSQVIRTDVLTQKARTGLILREGSEAVRAGNRRQAKYVEKVIVATDRRRVEQQIAEDKMLAKDKDKNKDAETFITQGFKDELKRRSKFEQELEQQELIDQKKAQVNLDSGRGFAASFYGHMLNDGLATSRGGEKIKEQAPAREGGGHIVGQAPRSVAAANVGVVKAEPEEEEDTPSTMEVEAGVKLEAKEEIKAEAAEERTAGGAPGVAEVAAPSSLARGTKRALEAQAMEECKEKREEKALSARERFLARKSTAAASA